MMRTLRDLGRQGLPILEWERTVGEIAQMGLGQVQPLLRQHSGVSPDPRSRS
jgi:hypothetical protein